MNQTFEHNFQLFKWSHLPGVGPKGLWRLHQLRAEGWHLYPEEVLRLCKIKPVYHRDFFLKVNEIENEEEQYYERFIKYPCVSLADDAYPPQLREIYDPPALLYFRGDLALAHKQSLAIIGSRQATYYGKNIVKQLIPPLVRENMVITSGLARGIDTAAHQETIRSQGSTIAVIGAGLDVIYPKENARLQEYIAKNHLLISEYPVTSKPAAHHFPMRNRIIAGLSWGVCVAESKEKSGTNITADLALNEGREVFAVPGNIFDKASNGCHKLIQDGAKCVWEASQILIERPVENFPTI